MNVKPFMSLIGTMLAAALILGACDASSTQTESHEPSAPASAVSPAPTPTAVVDSADAERPDWFGFEMTDVRTGQSFTIDDYADKVVLLETMAIWCPTCRKQADEVKRLHEILGDSEDLVSISLDVDMGEDAETLKAYAERFGYAWHFAVAPLLVARALGNQYSAQYLNPPVAPMLVIDRDGNVLGLPFGSVKSAEALQGVVEPLLDA